MIVLGPGSLYTSIIPNLLVEGIDQAIADADGLKVYVAKRLPKLCPFRDPSVNR